MKKETIIQKDGKYYRKCSVAMIATKEKSNLFFENHPDSLKKLIYTPGHIESNIEWKDVIYQHLYIISDEEPKDEDWVIAPWNGLNKENGVWKFKTPPCALPYWGNKYQCKKIIASTDEYLKYIKEENYMSSIGVGTLRAFLPLPSNEFLQAYCKAEGKINGVLVEYESDFSAEVQFIGKTQTTPIYPYKLKVSPDNTITIKTITQLSPEENLEIDNALQDKFDEGYVHRMNDEKDMHTKEEMFLNMQYYMEHCQLKGYVTPQDWIKDHKHF